MKKWPANLRREFDTPIPRPARSDSTNLAPLVFQQMLGAERKLDLLAEHYGIFETTLTDRDTLLLRRLCLDMFKGFSLAKPRKKPTPTVRNDMSEIILVFTVQLIMKESGVGVITACRKLKSREPGAYVASAPGLKARYYEALRKPAVTAAVEALRAIPPEAWASFPPPNGTK